MDSIGISSYYLFHYKLLRFFGLGYFHDPIQKNFNNFASPWYILYSSVQFIIWVILFSITLWMDIPYICHDLDKLMLNLTFSITFASSFVKLYIILFRNKEIQEIVYSIDHDFNDIMQSEIILKEIKNSSKRVTLSVLGFANLTVMGLITGGTIQAYFSSTIFYNKQQNNQTFTSSDRILPLPVYLPFNVNSDFVYAIAFMYQILGIAWYGNLVVIINTFMNTILIHLAGRFENLGYMIENLRSITILKMIKKLHIEKSILTTDDLNNVQLFNNLAYQEKLNIDHEFSEADINREMNLFLKKCIEHHIKLSLCVEKCEKTYSLGFLTHVLNNLSIVCHIMIQISENNILSIRFVTAMALFFTVVSEMLAQCYTGNELTLQAMSLANSAFNCEWYLADDEFKKSLIIIMMRAQKPVSVTAGKFTAISNSMFVQIMKGAYSFYAVIRNT